jgi:hypothetical protein
MTANGNFSVLNTRSNIIQGCAFGLDQTAEQNYSVGRGIAGVEGGAPAGVFTPTTVTFYNGGNPTPVNVPTTVVTRRYQVQLALGLMTQEKLIPTKYMASQLAVELTLETVANCVIAEYNEIPGPSANGGYTSSLASAINYCVHNVNMIPEILEFDACMTLG